MSCQQKWELNIKRTIIIALICFISLVILRRKGDDIRFFFKSNCDKDKLPDILHYYLPDCEEYYLYVEIFYFVIIIGSIVFSILKANLIVWYEIVLLIIIFSFIKIICSFLTILPDPSGICENKKTYGYCNELMPSGHMATLLIIIFCLWNFMNDKTKIVYIFLTILYAIGIISVKNHYTIDILMSFFVVYTLYNIVHPLLLNTC